MRLLKSDLTDITLYNLQTGKLEKEKIFGQKKMDLLYGSWFGHQLTNIFISQPLFSKFYGYLQKRKKSSGDIDSFIKKYNIDTSELEKPVKMYRNFNEFFIRKLKPEARPINQDHNILISPADSRLLAYQLKSGVVLPVKGRYFSVIEVISEKKLAKEFDNGICLVFRLAPSDYHRFCYIDDGQQDPVTFVRGRLHSVSPLSLNRGIRVFPTNFRNYCVMHTNNFMDIIQIEVGALTVGKIVQNNPLGHNFKRGEEKGYFEFGGSTIILFIKSDIVIINDDIMEYSSRGIETIVKYGSPIGSKKK